MSPQGQDSWLVPAVGVSVPQISGNQEELLVCSTTWPGLLDCANLGAVNSLVSSSSTPAAETSGLSCRARGFVSLPQGLSDCFLKDKARDAAIR